MLGQKGGWLWASSSGSHSHAVTVAMDNRNIFAEVALVRTYVLGSEWMFAGIGISQVVANGNVENFSEDYPRVIWRTNCATMTFHIGVYKCFGQGRWLANIW
jgi:hypothetical protein